MTAGGRRAGARGDPTNDGGGRVRPGPCRDQGSVTAELALALPVVVLVLAALLVTVGGLTVKLRCADAARGAARVAALGRSDGEVAGVAQAIAGAGSTVTVLREPPWVEVTVAASVPGGWLSGASLGLSASATAWAEP
jgi:hypothetical protein